MGSFFSFIVDWFNSLYQFVADTFSYLFDLLFVFLIDSVIWLMDVISGLVLSIISGTGYLQDMAANMAGLPPIANVIATNLQLVNCLSIIIGAYALRFVIKLIPGI